MNQWRYAGASEIAARVVFWRHGHTVDRVICHPLFSNEFEKVARDITPGFSSFEYRWAALGLRKAGKKAAQTVVERLRWSDPVSFAAVNELPEAGGVFALQDDQDCIFVQGTTNIRKSAASQTPFGQLSLFDQTSWRPEPTKMVWKYTEIVEGTTVRQSIVNSLVAKWMPPMNVPRVA